MVRYIPQAHFEKLCNDHVSGQSDEFEKELRSVIFPHTSPAIRQKALDFDQLIDLQEAGLRAQHVRGGEPFTASTIACTASQCAYWRGDRTLVLNLSDVEWTITFPASKKH